jgi:hypothetical protein
MRLDVAGPMIEGAVAERPNILFFHVDNLGLVR